MIVEDFDFQVNLDTATPESTIMDLIGTSTILNRHEATLLLDRLIRDQFTPADGTYEQILNHPDTLLLLLQVMENSLKEQQLHYSYIEPLLKWLPLHAITYRFLAGFAARNLTAESDDLKTPVNFIITKLATCLASQDSYIKVHGDEFVQLIESPEVYLTLFDRILENLPDIEEQSVYYHPYQEHLSFLLNHPRTLKTFYRRKVIVQLIGLIKQNNLNVRRMLSVTRVDRVGVVFEATNKDWMEVHIALFLEPHEREYYLRPLLNQKNKEA